MKKIYLLIIVIAKITNSFGQVVFYDNSSKLQGYTGPVKSIISYSQKTDSLHIPTPDTILSKTRELRWIKYFNKKGLLERVATVSRPDSTAAKLYKYDKDDRLVSILKEEDGRITAMIDSFVYDRKQPYVIQILNKPYNTGNGKVNDRVFRKRLWFDSLQRNTQIELLDSNNFTVRTTRLYYDASDRITGAESYTGTLLVNAWTQTYDSLGRKKKINSELIQTMYNWIDNETLIWEATEGEGRVAERFKEAYVRDAQGNIVKEYEYDLQAGTAMLYEYDIEYHE